MAVGGDVGGGDEQEEQQAGDGVGEEEQQVGDGEEEQQNHPGAGKEGQPSVQVVKHEINSVQSFVIGRKLRRAEKSRGILDLVRRSFTILVFVSASECKSCHKTSRMYTVQCNNCYG